MAKKTERVIWQLQSKLDRRFRAGHPWVYSNELIGSPKGIEPGAPVELHDASGKFLARGYGNPKSLISFRTLSRDSEETAPLSVEGFLRRLEEAGRFRQSLGLGEVSHRLCFGEGDRLPGLVIDRYLLAPERGPDAADAEQVLVIQIHTAGMDRAFPMILEALEKWVVIAHSEFKAPPWARTAIVLRNDLGVRKLEGLESQEPRVLRGLEGRGSEGGIEALLGRARIQVASAMPGEARPVPFQVDLLHGQKTGFFLDQWANIQLAAIRLSQLRPAEGKVLKILDLCCYVGQWSTQLSAVFRQRGLEVEVTAVDASQQALELATRNLESQGAKVHAVQGDVLKDLAYLPERGFDLVISDPPAFIKGRKDIPQGTHAYVQLNTQALRLVRGGGAIISCSCSSLLEEEKFVEVLSKASRRNDRFVRWIASGGQSPDHPVLAEFPEGRYLKARLGFLG